MNQRFLPQEKLKSKKNIAEVFARGNSIKFYPFVLWYLPIDAPCSQIAISVPKRRIATAVRRNLIKRRAREAFRLNKIILKQHAAAPHYAMIWVYIANEPLLFAKIEKGMIYGLLHLARTATLQT